MANGPVVGSFDNHVYGLDTLFGGKAGGSYWYTKSETTSTHRGAWSVITWCFPSSQR